MKLFLILRDDFFDFEFNFQAKIFVAVIFFFLHFTIIKFLVLNKYNSETVALERPTVITIT